MNALLEKCGLCTIRDKFFHLDELVCTTSFETLGIMKDEFVVAPENKFMLDVVHPALKGVDCVSCLSARRRALLTPLDPSTCDGSI